MGDAADDLTEQHLDAEARELECWECGSDLEWQDHKKFCKQGRGEE